MYKVVVIDDHLMVCAAIKSLLEADGRFQVVAEIGNGNAGIVAIRELEPDLVIVDLDIPVLGGMEVIRRVRLTHRDVAIVVVSAANESTYGLRALRMGAHGFVHKGRALEDLVTAATLAVQGKNFFSHEVMTDAVNHPLLPGDDSIAHLSERELEVFRRLAQGKSNTEIATQLLISNKTVSAHKRRIMERLGLSNIRDLIELAKTHGII